MHGPAAGPAWPAGPKSLRAEPSRAGSRNPGPCRVQTAVCVARRMLWCRITPLTRMTSAMHWPDGRPYRRRLAQQRWMPLIASLYCNAGNCRLCRQSHNECNYNAMSTTSADTALACVAVLLEWKIHVSALKMHRNPQIQTWLQKT